MGTTCDEGGGRGNSSIQDQKTRTVRTCRINPGSFPEEAGPQRTGPGPDSGLPPPPQNSVESLGFCARKVSHSKSHLRNPYRTPKVLQNVWASSPAFQTLQVLLSILSTPPLKFALKLRSGGRAFKLVENCGRPFSLWTTASQNDRFTVLLAHPKNVHDFERRWKCPRGLGDHWEVCNQGRSSGDSHRPLSPIL